MDLAVVRMGTELSKFWTGVELKTQRFSEIGSGATLSTDVELNPDGTPPHRPGTLLL